MENLIEKLLRRAINQSGKDGRIRFVYLHGIKLRRDLSIDSLWTNGQEYGMWRVGAPSGETAGTVTWSAVPQ